MLGMCLLFTPRPLPLFCPPAQLGGAPAPSVEFANLTFTVKLKSGGNKVLLKGVSGVCAAAKLTALMVGAAGVGWMCSCGCALHVRPLGASD